jgi:hypothetical protein
VPAHQDLTPEELQDFRKEVQIMRSVSFPSEHTDSLYQTQSQTQTHTHIKLFCWGCVVKFSIQTSFYLWVHPQKPDKLKL